jgi:hypothetical protein
MKIKGFFQDCSGSTALHYTMWLAIIGFALIVGVAVLHST